MNPLFLSEIIIPYCQLSNTMEMLLLFFSPPHLKRTNLTFEFLLQRFYLTHFHGRNHIGGANGRCQDMYCPSLHSKQTIHLAREDIHQLDSIHWYLECLSKMAGSSHCPSMSSSSPPTFTTVTDALFMRCPTAVLEIQRA